MDIIEHKSAAIKFLDEHERLANELASAKAMIDEQASNIIANEQMIAMQKEHIISLDSDKNRYMRYAVELSAQLQFIVAGAARALKIAQSVQAALNQESPARVPEISGTDQAELESLINRLGVINPPGFLPSGAPAQPSAATQMMQKPIA